MSVKVFEEPFLSKFSKKQETDSSRQIFFKHISKGFLGIDVISLELNDNLTN